MELGGRESWRRGGRVGRMKVDWLKFEGQGGLDYFIKSFLDSQDV